MGAYINPPDMTKEQWLAENAVPADTTPKTISEMGTDIRPVILVDNGAFTAAGIAFDERELQSFLVPDSRPRKWFWAELKKLHTVSPELKTYLKSA